MNWKYLLIVALLGMLLVQATMAASSTAETVKKAQDKAQEKVVEPLKKAAEQAQEKANEKVVEAKKAGEKAGEKIQEKVEEIKKEIPKAGEKIQEQVNEAKKAGQEKVVEPVKRAAEKAGEKIQEQVNEAKKVGQEKVNEARKAGEKAGEKVQEKVEEIKKEIPKAKEALKNEAKKAEASFVDTYLPIVQGYAQQASDLAQKYGAQAASLGQQYGGEAWEKTKEFRGTAGTLAQEYTANAAQATHARSVELVDKFFDPQHAQIIKKNYLNWYGVGILAAVVVANFFVLKHLKWVLSLTILRSFLSAFSLAIYATLASLTILSSEDPISHVPAAAKASVHRGLFGLAVAVTVLNVLAFLVLRAKGKSLIVAVLSLGLFVDHLDLRPKIEAAVGSIPAYSLQSLIFLVQAILIFDSISSQISPPPAPPLPSKPIASGSAAPGFIKSEIKKEKTVSGSRKSSKA